ncbi:hypothetical protein AAGM62_26375, partial [Klebsiella pneumoniae]
MMSLWDALRMNMMISYQELVRTFLSSCLFKRHLAFQALFSACFAFFPGFACMGCAGFQSFWPLALA